VGDTVTVQPPVTFVGSVALAVAKPPPETLTWLVTCDGAFRATFTVTVIGGKLIPAASALLVVQVGSTVQFHVAPPFIDTRVRPVGIVSVTVTVPLVGAVPVFDTVTPYVAPVCPCVKSPV
jgi:hypothetical protein